MLGAWLGNGAVWWGVTLGFWRCRVDQPFVRLCGRRGNAFLCAACCTFVVITSVKKSGTPPLWGVWWQKTGGAPGEGSTDRHAHGVTMCARENVFACKSAA